MKDINALRKEYDIIGKKFIYKSKYGGVTKGIISKVTLSGRMITSTNNITYLVN
jgi:hypothetical protein